MVIIYLGRVIGNAKHVIILIFKKEINVIDVISLKKISYKITKNNKLSNK